MIEILFSGLCAVSLGGSSNAFTSVEIGCPNQSNHLTRLTLPADQVTSWPSGMLAEWFVTPDGREYASIEIYEMTLKFDEQQAALKVVNGLDGLLSTVDISGTPVDAPSNKFVFTIKEGKVEASGPVGRCFEVPSEGSSKSAKPVYENLLWSLKGKVVSFFVNGSTDPIKVEGNSVRVGVTNDVRFSDDPTPGPSGKEFHHWIHATGFWKNEDLPKHPDLVECEKGETDEGLETLTSRPICNLLLVK